MRNLFLLFIMMLIPIMSFSQITSTQIVNDSIPVSVDDIKYSNLLFVEHESLIQENYLLNHQIHHYEELVNFLEDTNDLQKQEINCYRNLTDSYYEDIKSLKQEIKQKNKSILGWAIGGTTISIGLILLLIFK